MAERRAPPHVVIIGGGFAGLYLARGLARAPVRVTVIDRKNHHLFQPMLYQVASAALNPSEIAVPIRSVLRKQRNVEVLMGSVSRIDMESKQIELDGDGSIRYDYLAVATGLETSYYGRDRWKPMAPPTFVPRPASHSTSRPWTPAVVPCRACAAPPTSSPGNAADASGVMSRPAAWPPIAPLWR